MVGQLLFDLLNYNPDTGIFAWRCDRGRRLKAGHVAGTVDAGGYVVIGVRRKYYKAHRLAVLFVTGAWPLGVVDHINGDKKDNRICNLRDVTHANNCRNQKVAKNNKSGFKGVYWYKKNARWTASIRVDGNLHHLGYFDSDIAAALAYNAASEKLHGEFGRPSIFTAMLNPSDKRVDA